MDKGIRKVNSSIHEFDKYLNKQVARRHRSFIGTSMVSKDEEPKEGETEKTSIPCPDGVDADLWSRFQAFEQWDKAQNQN